MFYTLANKMFPTKTNKNINHFLENKIILHFPDTITTASL